MEPYSNSSRYKVLVAVLTLIFIIFQFRLIQLQILYKDLYGKKSEENSIRPIVLEPIRGYIYDRNGKLLVDNRPSFTVVITPAEFDTSKIPYLSYILRIEPNAIMDQYKKGLKQNRFAPIKIKRDIDFQTLTIIEENKEKLPGIECQIETKRYFPTSVKAPHLFGYIKEISESQLTKMHSYQLGDMIGAAGLEAFYEPVLRGQKGFQFVIVNARGQIVAKYNDGKNDVPIREGNDLYLSIDYNLQAFAESILTGKQGAIVAIDPSDGGVLTIVSKPDYDPEVLSGFTPVSEWTNLFNDPSKPLFNRATQTKYPPGSTFKMVLAAAALQEGKITTNWRINCTSRFQFGNRVFTDLKVHGATDIYEAIQRSCNVFFYQLMLKTGFSSWTLYGEEFGFGKKTGIDLLEEDAGILPSEEYYNKIYGKGKWTTGYTISLAIGQGEVGASPLQMACFAMVIGNGGYYHKPQVVKKIREKETGQVRIIPPRTRQVKISKPVLEVLREGMYRCVNIPGGTGLSARIPNVKAAGKTGTAENPHGKGHSWFIGYAPKDNPKIAICVLVENAGFGGAVAAPIAGLCMEKYLYGEIIRDNPTKVITSISYQKTEALQ